MRRRGALSDEDSKHETPRNRFLERLNFSHANRDRKCVVFADHDIRGSRSAFFCAIDNFLGGVLKVGHLLYGATDSDLPNLDRREAHAYRNRLAVLAADSNTLVEL